jgi:hypothetical protein
MSSLHIVLHTMTAAYSLTYSAYSAYCNLQNMQNMNPALLFCIQVVLHILHIVLHTAAYSLPYSANFAYNNSMQKFAAKYAEYEPPASQ